MSLPFNDLLFRAQTVHRRHFDPNRVQLSQLLNIKTGGCPEDCGYCSQSAHHATGLAASQADGGRDGASPRRARPRRPARRATAWARHGAIPSRATWTPSSTWSERVQGARARDLHDAGHARPRAGGAAERGRARLLQPQHRHLASAITARSSPPALFADRLDTLEHVREAGMKVCCGGIVGMGESRRRPRRHAGDPGQPARAIRKACRSTC